MKLVVSSLLLLMACWSAFAGARVVVPSLSEAATPDAEVSTNIALNVDATRLQTLTLSVAFDSCETNEMFVAIGTDCDNDCDLSLGEAAIAFGCDCGVWYRTDLRTAHAAKNRTVLAAYGCKPDTTEPEIVAHLFKFCMRG